MYRLVIVEDEDKIRGGLVNLFPWESIGYNVVGDFCNGKEAFDYLEAHSADVVLTDVCMPLMNGIELAKKIEENGMSITVVFLSAYRDFDYLHNAMLHGAQDYLVKPIKYDELVACFTRVKNKLAQQAPPTEDDTSYYQQIVRNVRQYAQENLCEATLEKAAARVNMSPSYLSRLFREQTGINFSDALVEMRMHKAAKLLKEIDYKLYEISEIVGYSSPKNFSRAFKHFYNVTPREYRNRE